MITNVIEDNNYQQIMIKQIGEIVQYLLDNNEEFSITANIKGTKFNPLIPESISKGFSQFTMFTLSNYTYSTILIENNTISFEAGFGKENFGSTVTIPFYAFFQIVVNESILFINPTATVEKYFLEQNQDRSEEGQINRSRNAFSMNPKNKKLLD